jgi:hypothetical protein
MQVNRTTVLAVKESVEHRLVVSDSSDASILGVIDINEAEAFFFAMQLLPRRYASAVRAMMALGALRP